MISITKITATIAKQAIKTRLQPSITLFHQQFFAFGTKKGDKFMHQTDISQQQDTENTD